jgi:hypothetical protein
MKSGPGMQRRSRRVWLLALGTSLVVAVVLGLATWLYAAPASAATTTTAGGTDQSTTAGSADTTSTSGIPDVVGDPDATPGTLPPGGVIPNSGSERPPDPSAIQMFSDRNNCLSCHADAALTELMTKQRSDGSSIALYVDVEGSSNSVHRYKDCTECHGTDPHASTSELTKLSLSEKCGSCHQYEYKQWKTSVHGAPQFSGNSDPATCTDCHSATSNPHNVVRVLDPLATTYPKNIAQTCAKCHDNPGLMDKYGIVEKVYSSYMRSFHGKAMKLAPKNSALQQLDTATCVSCHGAHNISSVSSPNAPVGGKDNLLETCRTCHPDAGPEFVQGFLGHKATSAETLPQVYWTGKGFYLFTRAMLAGGVLIVATSISLRGVPWTARKIRRRKKKEE